MHPHPHPEQPRTLEPKGKRRWPWLVAIAVLLVLLCGGMLIVAVLAPEEPIGSGARTGEGASQSAAAPVKKRAAAKIGQPVRDGQLEFIVKRVTCDEDFVGSGFSRKKARGDYCIVSLQVTNISNKPAFYLPEDQEAFIGTKRYQANSTASLVLADDDAPWLEELNPGTSTGAFAVYDVPSDKQLDRIMLHDSGFSSGVEVRLR